MLAVEIALLALLVAVAVAVARTRDLFAAVALFAIFSLLCALLFTLLDAPDVAITEAAVGAGMSAVLMLATMSAVGRGERARRRPPLVAAVVVLLTGAVLVFALADAPPRGAADAPAQVHVAPHYLAAAAEEVGIPNVVTAVLASYRGQDTLGEVAVIFAAGIGVLALLGRAGPAGAGRGDRAPPRRGLGLHAFGEHRVLRVIAKLLLPGILMFALYVQAHGEVSPGGGFSAGVVFATGFVLFALVFGVRRLRQVAPQAAVEAAMAAGLLLFTGVGFQALLCGGRFLDHDVLLAAPRSGQHLGILLVETGVGLTVAAVLIAVVAEFCGVAARGGRS